MGIFSDLPERARVGMGRNNGISVIVNEINSCSTCVLDSRTRPKRGKTKRCKPADKGVVPGADGGFTRKNIPIV
ncbi:hypothetical protein BPY_16160 [Bifidobacterium psychraerophilum]